MEHPEKVLLLIGTIAYMAALVLTLWRLLKRREPLHGVNFSLILAGWLVQSGGLYLLGMEAGSCPIRNLFEVLQFVSWSIVVLYLFTGQVFRLSLFGIGAGSLAAVLSFMAYLLPGANELTPTSYLGGNPRIEAHAALALFSYGIFGLLAVLSALYLMQSKSLKSKRLPGIFRFLPPLLDMDIVLRRLLIMACTVYTISVAIGALYWVGHMDEVALPKLILTLALWVAYWVVLILRLVHRLYGDRLAWTCIALLGAALFILWPVEASRDHSRLESTPTPVIEPDNAD